ncbi:MAG: hypothetical protein JNM94_07495 [Phycisphaerae bacterium]|nr:hypothetical protein [Phycisphaerae bacterium]
MLMETGPEATPCMGHHWWMAVARVSVSRDTRIGNQQRAHAASVVSEERDRLLASISDRGEIQGLRTFSVLERSSAVERFVDQAHAVEWLTLITPTNGRSAARLDRALDWLSFEANRLKDEVPPTALCHAIRAESEWRARKTKVDSMSFE